MHTSEQETIWPSPENRIMIVCSICSNSDWCDDDCDCACHDELEDEFDDLEDDQEDEDILTDYEGD